MNTAPPRIRTDSSNPFAHHTMAVRVPDIVDKVIEENRDYPNTVLDALRDLRSALTESHVLPALGPGVPHHEAWQRALASRAGERWLATDWFFAETYAYRQLADRADYWSSGRDPFAATKREEYASRAHAEAFEAALGLSGSAPERLSALLLHSLFGNRIDLSFSASLERGMASDEGDLLADDRPQAVEALLGRTGPVQLIVDNAGTELTLDLVLADFLLSELRAKVVVWVKLHPTFVSDATARDVSTFLGLAPDPFSFASESPAARACRERLSGAVRDGRMIIAEHPFFNEPESLWDMPSDLVQALEGARLVVVKGDANYRRTVGDALWPPETPFAEVAAYAPAPLLALRTLKSDAVVGLPPGRAAALDREDERWRVNGKRGVASFAPGRSPAR